MKGIKKIIPYFLFLFPAVAVAQNTGNTKLPGKWLLIKHTITEKGKTDDLLTSNEIYFFNFSSDATYEVSYTNKKNESTTIYKGKWKIVSNGKKLKLFGNTTLPPDPAILVGDRTLTIIRSTANELVIKELLFGIDLLGTSYYKKQ